MAAFGSALLLHACFAVHLGRTKLGVHEVVTMGQARVPADRIIEQMRASGTVYRLTASQLAKLHDDGVPDPVIDYMQRTYLRAVRRNQFLADESRWSLEPDGYWYGGLPYRSPPAWLGLADDEEEYHAAGDISAAPR